jgi:hypothetical protein
VAGRYSCLKGKVTGIAKANRVCLIRRCPQLQVQFKKGKYRQVIPITMIDNNTGC